jgi:DNA-binding transcriptional LysR family regulator
MFDPDLLRALVAVAETCGFTKAAATLNSTQSTVSAQIRRLEEQAGRTLFVRSTRSVKLTAAGETLLGYARTILRLQEDVRLRLAGTRHSRCLRIGAAEDLADQWLPRVLRAFANEHPQVRIELEIGIGTRLFEKLDDKELDLVIGGECSAPLGRRLWTEPLVWAFADKADIPKILPTAFFPEPCPYREAALRALAAAAVEWRPTCSSSSLAGVRAAARAGLAVTPLPEHAVGPGLRILGTKDGVPPLPPVSYAVRSRADDFHPALAAFEAALREHALPAA